MKPELKLHPSKNYFAVPHTVSKRCCPECKSDHIRFRSRRNYIIKAILCTGMILLCYYGFRDFMTEEVDPVVLIGLFIFVVAGLISVILLVNNGVRAVLIKTPDYKCVYCKSAFVVPLNIIK